MDLDAEGDDLEEEEDDLDSEDDLESEVDDWDLDFEDDGLDLEDVFDLDDDNFNSHLDVDLEDEDFDLDDFAFGAGEGDGEGDGERDGVSDEEREVDGELVGVDHADDTSGSAGGGVPALGSGVSARLRVGRPAMGRGGGGIDSALTTLALPATGALPVGGGHRIREGLGALRARR